MPDSKVYIWDEDKNTKLKCERNVSFESVVYAIQSGGLLATLRHPNQDKYQGQFVHLVFIDRYVFVVPFIENDDYIVLKTVFPSRKATRDYWKGVYGNDVFRQ